MSKAIFFGFPIHGHIYPTLPLVKELVARGEEIIYYTSPRFKEKIERTGAHFRNYHSPFLTDPAGPGLPGAFGRAGKPEYMMHLPYFLVETTREMLDREMQRIIDDHPDYILFDTHAPWGKCMAELLRVPAVSSLVTFAFSPEVMALADSSNLALPPAYLSHAGLQVHYLAKSVQIAKSIQRAYGVKVPKLSEIMFCLGALNIVYTSRYFQPFSEKFNDSFQFVGPMFVDDEDPLALPWKKQEDKAMVYISLGTVFNRNEEFYQLCFQALGKEKYNVILTTGGESAEGLKNAPNNFFVSSFVPQVEVLKRAQIFITHGSVNSVGQSLYWNVPVIVIPQAPELSVVAKRVEAFGAGIYLQPREVSALMLRRAVNQVLAEARFRQNCQKISASLKAAGGAVRAVDEIFKLKNRQST